MNTNMLSNKIDLVLYSDHPSNKSHFSIRDKHQTFVENVTFNNCNQQTISLDIKFPNTLFVDIVIDDNIPSFIYLEKLTLAGLALSDHVMEQICIFSSESSNETKVSRTWNQSGTVLFEFFALDWIQYHLLYKNKITF